MPINKRNLAVSIILTIVTCGIYGIYWFIVMTDDTKNVSGDINGASGGVAFLLTLVTCNIYGYYWAYKQGERIDNAKNARGIPSSNSNVLYLILAIFGLYIVVYERFSTSGIFKRKNPDHHRRKHPSWRR